MTDRQAQMAERIARQNQIDETFVDPVWGKAVDIPLLELSFASSMPKSPVILMPELRFRSFLKRLVECLPGTGKIMIVDGTNARFEGLRKCAEETSLSLYFSTQEVSALNYADNIFHFVLTEIGLATACRAEAVFPAYYRILKPGGYFICSMPLIGSFPAFFDILEETLFLLLPQRSQEMMEELKNYMTMDTCLAAMKNSGFEIVGSDTVTLDLDFPSVEQMLFSSLVESHYLGYCLSLVEPGLDPKQLLTILVRAFHHYLQGESIHIQMQLGIFTAKKPAAET